MSPDGVLVVDKPTDWTSHDVVGRVRRLANTRKVGHAGTLDPMATGLLVVGVGKATRLLTYLSGCDKTYQATIRLGQSRTTDDAAGEVVASAPAAHLDAAAIRAVMGGLTGPIDQIPSTVSAIKINGQRAYALARAGQAVELAARPVTVKRFELVAARPMGDWLDLDVVVECSAGTYVRALARDLGARLAVGGHVTALRRTQLGPYDLADARTLDQLAVCFELMSPAEAAARSFPVRRLSADEVRQLSFGRSLAGIGPLEVKPPQAADVVGAGSFGLSGHSALEAKPRQAADVVAAISPDGDLIALLAPDGAKSRPLVVFAAA